MPIVYEHWRPDTNECFYVGMSVLDETGALARANNFARPYNKYHTNIVRKLVSNGLEPFAVIVETYADPESAKAREKMQIAYRRATIGNRLTNVTNGGDGGPILFGKARNSSVIQGEVQISTALTRYFQAEKVDDSPSEDWQTTAS